MGPVRVNIKFGLVHIFPDLLITRFVHRGSGWSALAYVNITLTFFSERWPQAPLLPRVDDGALSEVNAIISSIGVDVAQF